MFGYCVLRVVVVVVVVRGGGEAEVLFYVLSLSPCPYIYSYCCYLVYGVVVKRPIVDLTNLVHSIGNVLRPAFIFMARLNINRHQCQYNPSIQRFVCFLRII